MKNKLRKILLAREVKAAFVLSLVAIFLFGGISILNNIYKDQININEPDDDDEVVVKVDEKLILPFKVSATVETYYFDVDDPVSKQQESLIYFDGVYRPSQGIDYSFNNTKFDVAASFGGSVTERKVDPMYGYLVKITGENGVSAVYASLSEVYIQVGEKVSQGQIIGKAGTSPIRPDLNNHLHFALMKNDKLINPMNYFNTKIKDIT